MTRRFIFLDMQANENGHTLTEALAWQNHHDPKGERFKMVEVAPVDGVRVSTLLSHEEREKAYMEGVNMTKKLMRLRLGLAVPGDEA